MNVLGIETSCDETSVAVVEDGRVVRSNVVLSQMAEHARYGGVVPEIASRRHVENITAIVDAALRGAGVAHGDLSAIAVTNRPGLMGALIVGVSAAKALAMAWNLPLVGVHHIEAHFYANFLRPSDTDADAKAPDADAQATDADAKEPDVGFPAVALVVSGGHTDLFHLRAHGNYTLLGRTRDDAAGEAFDKCARLMGLDYPGGPAISAAAQNGDARAVSLPRAWLDGETAFSFSGLKTAVRNVLTGANPPKTEDLAASFEAAVVDVLVRKTVAAAQGAGVERVFLAGGVAANRRLRAEMRASCDAEGLGLHYPPPDLCTDNGAMIACAAYWQMQSGHARTGLGLSAVASEPLALR